MPHVTVDGVKINYSDSGGSGTPVVLLHAFPFTSQMWEPQFEALGDRYRLIAPDLKGFGDSDAPDTPAAYSMGAYALEVKGLLDELGITTFVLVGLSMGGYIAFAFLRQFRDAVRGLVLADTRSEADPPEGVERRTKQQEQVAADGVGGLADTLVGVLLSDATRQNLPEVVDRARKLMDNPAAGYVGALEAMKNRPDSTDELTGISVPTLIVVGEKDGITPPDAARTMHGHIGGSQLVVIPDAGHISNLEAPEAFNAALDRFLDELHSEGEMRR